MKNRVTVILVFLIFVVVACKEDTNRRVVVYTSVDQHYSEPIFQEFEKRTNIKVYAVYDMEASKTTGLVNRLIAEKKRAKADVFWNGEFAQTLRLAKNDILEPYRSINCKDKLWSDFKNRWCAFGGRARVIIINKNRFHNNKLPSTLDDLLNNRYQADKIAMATPLFGTSATQAALLWSSWGKKRASSYFYKLKSRGIHFVNGNSLVRDKVSSGEFYFGVVDSDDACSAIKRGAPIIIRFLKSNSSKVTVIPNSVALISNGANKENAKKFIDFLLSEETQERLIKLGWFHIVNAEVKNRYCPLPSTIKIEKPDIKKLLPAISNSRKYLRELFFQ